MTCAIWSYDCIKHCEKRLPLQWRSFRVRSNFPPIWFQDLRFRIWGLEIKHLKAHNFVWQGCLFFLSYLATSTTDWAQIFTGLLFHALYVDIHQVRRQVFYNYQQCPQPLKLWAQKRVLSKCERVKNTTLYILSCSSYGSLKRVVII